MIKTKKEARRLGNKLLKRMRGDGWELDVWQNIGWHYCVRANEVISVYPVSERLDETKYTCLLGGQNYGVMLFSETFSHEDPNVVVEHQLEFAQEALQAFVDKHQGIIDQAKEATKCTSKTT